MRGIFQKDWILGGDWNCVPDTTLDVQSTKPLSYANIGATLLGDITREVGLHDFRREQLGNHREPTIDEV